MYYTDLQIVEARLAESTLPQHVRQAYLQVLSNLNAISTLLAPSDDTQDDPASSGLTELQQLFQAHQKRRTALEAKYPELVILTRPQWWSVN